MEHLTKMKSDKLDSKTSSALRNPGLDLMRIISIIMVVGLHLLGHGGILKTAGNENFPLWSIEALMSVAVNCYVLLSGYFLVTSKFKLRKLFWIYFQVVTYTLVFYLIFASLSLTPFSLGKLIQMLLPITTRKYWFISCYAGLYLISPFLNKLILSLTKRQMQIFVLLLILFFCRFNDLLPMFSTLNTDNGYGVVWFIVLYCAASYIRLFYDYKINRYIYLFLYIVLSFATSFLFTRYGYNNLYNYASALIFLSSIFLFLFFRELKLKNIKIINTINTLAPLTLGIYLISDNRYIRSVLYTSIIKVDVLISAYNIYVIIFVSIFAIFFVCAAIEYIRKNTIFGNFEKNKKINSFIDSIQNKIFNIDS